MVEIDHKIIITGILSLAARYMCMMICNRENSLIEISIITAIALAIGVVIPSPKIDNSKGVLKWWKKKQL